MTRAIWGHLSAMYFKVRSFSCADDPSLSQDLNSHEAGLRQLSLLHSGWSCLALCISSCHTQLRLLRLKLSLYISSVICFPLNSDHFPIIYDWSGANFSNLLTSAESTGYRIDTFPQSSSSVDAYLVLDTISLYYPILRFFSVKKI